MLVIKQFLVQKDTSALVLFTFLLFLDNFCVRVDLKCFFAFYDFFSYLRITRPWPHHWAPTQQREENWSLSVKIVFIFELCSGSNLRLCSTSKLVEFPHFHWKCVQNSCLEEKFFLWYMSKIGKWAPELETRTISVRLDFLKCVNQRSTFFFQNANLYRNYVYFSLHSDEET